jgi:hypothetical protein
MLDLRGSPCSDTDFPESNIFEHALRTKALVNVFGQGYPLLTNLLNKYTGSLEGFWIWEQPLMMEFQENMFGFGIREKTRRT